MSFVKPQDPGIPQPVTGPLQQLLRPPPPQQSQAPPPQQQDVPAGLHNPTPVHGLAKVPALPLGAWPRAATAAPVPVAASSSQQQATAWTQFVFRDPQPTAPLHLPRPAPQQVQALSGSSYARQMAAYRQKVAATAAAQPAASSAAAEPPLPAVRHGAAVATAGLRSGPTVEGQAPNAASLQAAAGEPGLSAQQAHPHAPARGTLGSSPSIPAAGASSGQALQAGQHLPTLAPLGQPSTWTLPCAAANGLAASDARPVGSAVFAPAAGALAAPDQDGCQRIRGIRAAAHSIAASAAALRDAERTSGRLLAQLGLASTPAAAQAPASGAGEASNVTGHPMDVRLAAAVAALQSRRHAPLTVRAGMVGGE